MLSLEQRRQFLLQTTHGGKGPQSAKQTKPQNHRVQIALKLPAVLEVLAWLLNGIARLRHAALRNGQEGLLGKLGTPTHKKMGRNTHPHRGSGDPASSSGSSLRNASRLVMEGFRRSQFARSPLTFGTRGVRLRQTTRVSPRVHMLTETCQPKECSPWSRWEVGRQHPPQQTGLQQMAANLIATLCQPTPTKARTPKRVCTNG